MFYFFCQFWNCFSPSLHLSPSLFGNLFHLDRCRRVNYLILHQNELSCPRAHRTPSHYPLKNNRFFFLSFFFLRMGIIQLVPTVHSTFQMRKYETINRSNSKVNIVFYVPGERKCMHRIWCAGAPAQCKNWNVWTFGLLMIRCEQRPFRLNRCQFSCPLE